MDEDELRALIETQYQLVYTELDLGGCVIKACYAQNLDELFDELVSKGENHPDVEDERIPYWADLWPASIGLARYLMAENQVAIQGAKVLELGAGLGLAGLAAHLQGGKVTVTDYEPAALHLAQYFWLINEQIPFDAQVMDWRQPNPELMADVVIAADVAYEERFYPDLLRCFQTVLRPGGRIIISEPNRKIGRSWLLSLVEDGKAQLLKEEKVDLQGLETPVGIFEVFADRLS